MSLLNIKINNDFEVMKYITSNIKKGKKRKKTEKIIQRF